MQKRIDSIEEVHKILLQIVEVFHEICLRNNISYYMVYGSMLGAKRHNGFIPWDDDMDVAIHFREYEKLVAILKEQLPARYRLLTRYDNRGAAGGYLKIEDTTTIVVEKVKKAKENSGIFIDVFTLYPASGNTSFFSRYQAIKFLRLIQVNRFFRVDTHSSLKVLLLRSSSRLFFWWLKRPTLINFIERYLIPKDGNYLCTYSTKYNTKDIIPKDYYGSPVLYAFEKTQLYGVADPQAYLTSIYGDYMKLPPEDKREFHLLEMYYL